MSQRVLRQRRCLWATLRKVPWGGRGCEEGNRDSTEGLCVSLWSCIHLVLLQDRKPPPPPLCTAWVIVPAARGDAGHATAKDKLLEIFPPDTPTKGMPGCFRVLGLRCHHFTSLLHWLSQVLGLVVLGAVGMSILNWLLCWEDFSVLVHKYIAPGFDLEKLRLQSIITPIFVCMLVQALVPSVPYAW